ncbi:hypothetical protein TCARB_0894 [Thermofilum adornatum 1505]|uniref:Uncharacterized protein n=1 Tax=Thermofilum adornatum 1505 TaxID=697581 RepID=A0A3G1A8X2_9CREN|nr:hypothetical protein TCARB_0894 [Thermofilum adornatum 1505]
MARLGGMARTASLFTVEVINNFKISLSKVVAKLHIEKLMCT